MTREEHEELYQAGSLGFPDVGAAIAAERERCAKICDQRAATWTAQRAPDTCAMSLEEECEDIAAAIRRG